MFIIAFRGFGNSTREKTLANCMSLLDLVCFAKIFYNKERARRCGIYFTLLIFAKAFRGVPFSIFLLNWVAVCNYSL